jgi:hypothetical protein
MCGSLTSITISLTPILINRAMVSLKKAAQAHTGTSEAWSVRHFSTTEFRTEAVPVPPVATTSRLPNDLLESWLDTDGHNDIPLDKLA